MRYLLVLWFVPLVLFWGWYGLASNDINFGILFFSRDVHDAVFTVYGNAIGVPAMDVPALVAGACALDTAIVAAIAAFRWRSSWLPDLKAMFHSFWNDDEYSFIENEDYSNDPMHPAE